MAHSIPIDTRDITITPVFRHETVEDVPASEREGRAIMRTFEVVEVRFAGSKLYSPVFRVDDFWRRDGHRILTYAERWPDQYRAFLEGSAQSAAGTPLEMLRPYGISDAQLSLCRALRIYSIEALDNLEGQNLKNLQMNANPLKDMARRYVADRAKGADTAKEIEELKAQIAAMQAAMVPAADATPVQIETALRLADAEFEAMSDADLKAHIKDRTGQAPRGTPSREWLLNAARELAA